MANFNPDSADPKLVLRSLTAKHERILSILDNSQPQGFVTWQANSDHKAFYQSLQLGLSFLRTNCVDEWAVLGNGVFALVRGMPIFEELESPEIACGLIYIGNIRRMKVYLRPWPAQTSTDYFIGHDNSCVKAAALDFPVAYADEQPAPPPAERGFDPNMMPLEDYGDLDNIDEPVYEEPEPPRDAPAPRSPIWDLMHDWLKKDDNPF